VLNKNGSATGVWDLMMTGNSELELNFVPWGLSTVDGTGFSNVLM